MSSGSEAVEKCIQFARVHAMVRGEGSRWKVIGRYPSYHGSTLGALAISGDLAAGVMQPYLRESPRVPAPLSYRIPGGQDAEGFARHCLAALEHTIQREGPETVLAFIMEPVIGLSGGAVSAPDFYYGEVRKICDRHGVLLIYDEVISGAGRTGRFLAAHHWPEARPDLVVLAKGLGGGYYPLGAFLAPAAMVAAVAEKPGFHYGHTHKGSPLGCAVGLAVLSETLERGLVANAEATGAYLRQRLSALMPKIPILGDVRGKGLLNAIEIVADQATKAMLPRELDVIGDIKAIALEQGPADLRPAQPRRQVRRLADDDAAADRDAGGRRRHCRWRIGGADCLRGETPQGRAVAVTRELGGSCRAVPNTNPSANPDPGPRLIGRVTRSSPAAGSAPSWRRQFP